MAPCLRRRKVRTLLFGNYFIVSSLVSFNEMIVTLFADVAAFSTNKPPLATFSDKHFLQFTIKQPYVATYTHNIT